MVEGIEESASLSVVERDLPLLGHAVRSVARRASEALRDSPLASAAIPETLDQDFRECRGFAGRSRRPLMQPTRISSHAAMAVERQHAGQLPSWS